MKTFRSFDDALHYAINSAKECAEFYSRLSNQARNNKIKRLFSQYAREEYAQMVSLSRIRYSFAETEAAGFPFSLELYDCHAANAGKEDPNYSEALVIAMRKARSSFRLFLELSSKSPDEESSNILRTLAHKEAKHRQGVEVEYNESLLIYC
ncbi:Rubrerythrin [Lentimicrobium saccharophilum]|uniref:Rubrerythrin n=1 Tax=Lentimicrobium saccharophilum TaxID=1678841 RepID=A0A0S7C6I9_9BACT|nr:ferritin family protein [Lentimicrobium saccharophilum]GAP44771.1 Rubrerythrin [Lentimicrobium saccharophilum]